MKSIKIKKFIPRYCHSIKSGVGFTLIELLVVISVITLLSSMVFAKVQGARYKAKITAAQASLNNAFLGAVLCIEDGKPLNSDTEDTCDAGSSFFLAPNSDPEVPICQGSVNNWPNISKYGFSYGICVSNILTDQFVLMTSDGNNDIVCAYNFKNSTINNTGRCDIIENGNVGTCQRSEGVSSGKLCNIGQIPSTCPVGESCQSL